jgi:integrase
VRIGGADEAIPLGNTADGWDEARTERARQQTLAKIELGLWSPSSSGTATAHGEEPTFAELATDWLADRELNPAISSRTTEDDRWRLTRYLIPFFGELRPSQITPLTIKQYRRHIHEDNQQIRAARDAGNRLTDPRSEQPLRTLSNDSINKTLRTLAAILDEAEDAGWVDRNVARGRRMREPVERRTTDALDGSELVALLEAAAELDRRHTPTTLARASEVRALRDEANLAWKEVAARVGVSTSTAHYLYAVPVDDHATIGPRRAVVATLGFAGPRVSELCALDRQHVDLTNARIYVRHSKTAAGVRTVDIRPRLLDELRGYASAVRSNEMNDPLFPTRTGRRRDRNNVLDRVIVPVVARANVLRADRDEPPIRAHVTPHTFRRTYITIMLAAGFDLPYVKDQVGHVDPTTTLGIYAKLVRRPDRDAMRAEMRELLGEESEASAAAMPARIERPAAWRNHSKRADEREGLER